MHLYVCACVCVGVVCMRELFRLRVTIYRRTHEHDDDTPCIEAKRIREEKKEKK